MSNYHPDDTQSNQFGEIVNESARDPFTNTWPGVPSRASSGAVDMASKQAASNAEIQGPATAARVLEVEARVRAVFDSRPVNAFDGIFSARFIVEV